MLPGLCQKDFFMKFNSVLQIRFVMPVFLALYLFFHSLFPLASIMLPNISIFFIVKSFFSFFHMTFKSCVFSSPTIFPVFVPHYPSVSQTCLQNCTVLQGHSCSSQTLFHSTLIFKALIISEVLPIIW